MWLVSSFKKKILVYDSHEYFLGIPEIQNRYMVKKVWTAIERFIFPRLKYVFTVNKSISNLYFKDYQIRPKVIRNIPKSNKISNEESRENLGLPKNQLIVILQGSGINVHRGSEELLEAIASQDKYFLCIVGMGDVVSDLKLRASEDDLKNKILFVPPLSYNRMLQYTLNCDVGVSLDKNNNINHKFSLPNKIFDYSKSKIPFVATNLIEIKNVVDEYKTGVLINSLSPISILKGLDKAIELKKTSEFFDNILRMNTDLNWEKEAEVLVKTYNNFK